MARNRRLERVSHGRPRRVIAARHGLGNPALGVLADHPAVLAAVGSAVEAANGKLSRAGQIKRFAVLPVS